jgi:UDP-N-acetylglucosamine/UDP-N-acetylgalactosamine diphosphorylase
MLNVPDELRKRLQQFGQEHVLAGWERLNDAERGNLIEQLQALDFEQLRTLYQEREQCAAVPERKRITPIARVEHEPESREKHRAVAEAAWRKGEVAVLIVAGGQGTRLGFDHPKGLYPIGPVTNKSLFQIHAEKVLALGRRYRVSVPLLIMTSPATHEETEAFFHEHGFFGLPREEVFFFRQGTMPALDLATGKLLLEAPGRLFSSPNGHGGTLTALESSGLLDRLRDRGIRTVFYFQVDNPMVKVADLDFLGGHVAAGADVSAKVVPKEAPEEKVGIFVLVDGRLTIIEYSDLPDDMARETDEQGRLRYWAGNIAIHLFQVDFLERVARGPNRIPWHLARKKVPYLDEHGKLVQPPKENALKFEMFIFDAFPQARRWTLVSTTRQEEFMPLKNAAGLESPEMVRQYLSNQAADWLEKAGVRVPRKADGAAAVPLEISPLLALDADELAARVDRNRRIDGPTYLV